MTVYQDLLDILNRPACRNLDAELLRRLRTGLRVLEELPRGESTYYPNAAHAASELALLAERGRVLFKSRVRSKRIALNDTTIMDWVDSLVQSIDNALAPGPTLVVKTMHLTHGVRELLVIDDTTTVQDIERCLIERHKASIIEYIILNSYDVPDSELKLDMYLGLPDEAIEPRPLDPELRVVTLPSFDTDGLYWWPRCDSPTTSEDEELEDLFASDSPTTSEDEELEDLFENVIDFEPVDKHFKEITYEVPLVLDSTWTSRLGLYKRFLFNETFRDSADQERIEQSPGVHQIHQYFELVIRVGRAYLGTRLDIEDIIDTGMMALIEACHQYVGLSKDVFQEKVVRLIKWHIWHEGQTLENHVLFPSEIDNTVVYAIEDIDSGGESHLDLQYAIDQLRDDERYMMQAYLQGHDSETTARMLRISVSSYYRRFEIAINHLRLILKGV